MVLQEKPLSTKKFSREVTRGFFGQRVRFKLYFVQASRDICRDIATQQDTLNDARNLRDTQSLDASCSRDTRKSEEPFSGGPLCPSPNRGGYCCPNLRARPT